MKISVLIADNMKAVKPNILGLKKALQSQPNLYSAKSSSAAAPVNEAPMPQPPGAPARKRAFRRRIFDSSPETSPVKIDNSPNEETAHQPECEEDPEPYFEDSQRSTTRVGSPRWPTPPPEKKQRKADDDHNYTKQAGEEGVERIWPLLVSSPTLKFDRDGCAAVGPYVLLQIVK